MFSCNNCCNRQRGQLLLSVVLFGTLLMAAGLSLQLLWVQNKALGLAVFVNQIENRRNLIRAEALKLQRPPTASELVAAQQATAVTWPFDVVAQGQDQLRWRLYLSRTEWQRRLQERVGGEINGQYWLSVEPVPIRLDD